MWRVMKKREGPSDLEESEGAEHEARRARNLALNFEGLVT